MTPEARQFLDKAHHCLSNARKIASVEVCDDAARAAYLAAFHAAQALIFERTRKVARTHSGVRAEFARLAKDDPRIDRTLTKFLARGFDLKSIADYSIDPNVSISVQEMETAIETAGRFVACAAGLMEPADPSASGKRDPAP